MQMVLIKTFFYLTALPLREACFNIAHIHQQRERERDIQRQREREKDSSLSAGLHRNGRTLSLAGGWRTSVFSEQIRTGPIHRIIERLHSQSFPPPPLVLNLDKEKKNKRTPLRQSSLDWLSNFWELDLFLAHKLNVHEGQFPFQDDGNFHSIPFPPSIIKAHASHLRQAAGSAHGWGGISQVLVLKATSRNSAL